MSLHDSCVPVNPKFVKFDAGKVRYDLFDPYFENEVGNVLTYGATKYNPYNWCKAEEIDRLYSALRRHVYAMRCGDYTDKETGFRHAAHAACNLMFWDWHIRNGRSGASPLLILKGA